MCVCVCICAHTHTHTHTKARTRRERKKKTQPGASGEQTAPSERACSRKNESVRRLLAATQERTCFWPLCVCLCVCVSVCLCVCVSTRAHALASLSPSPHTHMRTRPWRSESRASRKAALAITHDRRRSKTTSSTQHTTWVKRAACLQNACTFLQRCHPSHNHKRIIASG